MPSPRAPRRAAPGSRLRRTPRAGGRLASFQVLDTPGAPDARVGHYVGALFASFEFGSAWYLSYLSLDFRLVEGGGGGPYDCSWVLKQTGERISRRIEIASECHSKWPCCRIEFSLSWA